MTRLDGNNLFLRELSIEDATEYLALRIRNRTFLTPYDPITPEEVFTLPGCTSRLRNEMEEQATGRSQSFAMCRAGDGALVGRIRVTNICRGAWHNANLGYFVDEASNGLGYATEAVRLATSWCFAEASLHRVQAATLTDNPRSMRVLEKNGFRREGIALRYLCINGVWRDHALFAVTVEEWNHITGES